MKKLDNAGIEYFPVDADVNFDESQRVEELVDSVSYPILEVYIDRETIFYVNDDIESRQLSDGIFVQVYYTFDNLVHEIKNLIK
jgi:sulfur carrier protein ThiS